MKWIDAEQKVNITIFDEQTDDRKIETMTIEEILDAYTDEGCPEGRSDLEGDWVPISKDLPEELIPVNVTWVNHDPPSYYRADKDKRFVDTAVYYQGDWYWWDSVAIDYLKEYGKRAPVHRVDQAIEIIAWRPLPEPWEGEQDE